MSRTTPTSLFHYIFPSRKDPQNLGHYLCRFCGKSTTHTRRVFYCSDECYNLCQKAVSWLSVRREVWKRDGCKCVRCGDPVLLYDGWHKVGEGKEAASCHHIKPVKKLRGMAVDAVFNDENRKHIPDEKKEYWYCRFYAMLYLDINNLITLCSNCHNIAHAADNRNQSHLNPFKVARTKWGGFWKQIEVMQRTRTLEDFPVV